MITEKLRKYFVMGSKQCLKDPAAVLEEAASAGVTAFQFREKGKGALEGEKRKHLGLELREICRHHGIPFIVNDDIDLAVELEADGIHVGQSDQDVSYIKRHYPEWIVGLSVSNAEEVLHSPINQVDYLGAGPLFQTTTKEDAKEAVGLKWIKRLRGWYPHVPIVGIGGINTRNAASVIEAGADGVAVISAITKADSVNEAVRDL
ncbi:thiamine phosphate synthase [Halobacillus litoralis]|uniref:thiamine phosphate synthase n=1 Tax=Halobacillus litoralis TaxID=45668 RepID=UPI001CD583DD|nr:thiamine phosphate synthase [Halobacillus litoralis]MCA0969430.1 thiamine phosphate synthase [Halobacillus litoralis]